MKMLTIDRELFNLLNKGTLSLLFYISKKINDDNEFVLKGEEAAKEAQLKNPEYIYRLIKQLREKNIVCRIKKGFYMLNPNLIIKNKEKYSKKKIHKIKELYDAYKSKVRDKKSILIVKNMEE